MQTATTSAHVLRLAADLLAERGLPALTDEQADVMAEAVDRWYGVPLHLPTPADLAAYEAKHPRQQQVPFLLHSMVRVMLALVRSDYGNTRTLRRIRRRPRGRRRGLIMLNAVGWAALIALGSLVSVLGSIVLPLPAALALGLMAGSAAYAVEWLFTWRDLQTTIDGFADADEAQAAVRELRQHGIHADMVRDPDADMNSEHGTARLTILARHRRRALRVLGQRKTR